MRKTVGRFRVVRGSTLALAVTLAIAAPATAQAAVPQPAHAGQTQRAHAGQTQRAHARPVHAEADRAAGARPVRGEAARTVPAADTRTTAVELVFVRDGNVLVVRGGAEKQLTKGGGAARPRWSPDGRRIAYLLRNRLWIMNADGSGQRRLNGHATGGADWSPDGKWLAFAAPGCTGGPVVYRIAATGGKAVPEVLFPAECKGQPLPTEKPEPARGGTLAERIAVDDAVSWAPDGKRIAFRGGLCESIYDACLTIGTVPGATERAVATFGGGGQRGGFAAVPSWRPDGARLTWTATTATSLSVVEFDPATGAKRTVGAPGDRELSYLTARTAFVTGERDGRSWIFQLDPGGSTRVALRQGSQPDPRP